MEIVALTKHVSQQYRTWIGFKYESTSCFPLLSLEKKKFRLENVVKMQNLHCELGIRVHYTKTNAVNP